MTYRPAKRPPRTAVSELINNVTGYIMLQTVVGDKEYVGYISSPIAQSIRLNLWLFFQKSVLKNCSPTLLKVYKGDPRLCTSSWSQTVTNRLKWSNSQKKYLHFVLCSNRFWHGKSMEHNTVKIISIGKILYSVAYIQVIVWYIRCKLPISLLLNK